MDDPIELPGRNLLTADKDDTGADDIGVSRLSFQEIGETMELFNKDRFIFRSYLQFGLMYDDHLEIRRASYAYVQKWAQTKPIETHIELRQCNAHPQPALFET